MMKQDDSVGTELYRYKREYRYALGIILGERKLTRAVRKCYEEELAKLDIWFDEKIVEDLIKKSVTLLHGNRNNG